jgi:hypothetical protein
MMACRKGVNCEARGRRARYEDMKFLAKRRGRRMLSCMMNSHSREATDEVSDNAGLRVITVRRPPIPDSMCVKCWTAGRALPGIIYAE